MLMPRFNLTSGYHYNQLICDIDLPLVPPVIDGLHSDYPASVINMVLTLYWCMIGIHYCRLIRNAQGLIQFGLKIIMNNILILFPIRINFTFIKLI